jgi:hypothetical protein
MTVDGMGYVSSGGDRFRLLGLNPYFFHEGSAGLAGEITGEVGAGTAAGSRLSGCLFIAARTRCHVFLAASAVSFPPRLFVTPSADNRSAIAAQFMALGDNSCSRNA